MFFVRIYMQCAFGLMLGTELVWRRIKSYGKALMVTTLTQSLGTFLLVSLVFGIVFQCMGIPVYLAFALGGIALVTAPAPALSIVSEFHTKGPVTNTLLPMAVLDDIVGIAVFFTVNAFIARNVSGGSVSLLMIPVMIFLPIVVGALIGKAVILVILIVGITVTMTAGYLLNTKVFTNITLNYMLLGVSLVFTGIVCATLEGGGESELAVIVKETIAAAAVINEIIAVIMAKRGFERAGEIRKTEPVHSDESPAEK